MASVINTNSLSLLTQNNLNKSQASLNTAIQRLSSGLRINSAKDDAAGQAIANRFTANIRGLQQAQRNANDGISMAQTTEGALSEINTNLQRIRELTVQANNATNSDADKTSIQAEIEQRMAEIQRTTDQTDFNGTKVLKENQSLSIQVGAKDNEVIRIDLKEMSVDKLGLTGFNIDNTGMANTAATKENLVAAGYVASPPGAGATAYTQTLPQAPVNNVAAKADDVFALMADGGTVATGGRTYTYASATSNYTAAQQTAQTDASVEAALTPAAAGLTAATITIGTGGGATPTDVLIDSSGKITSAAGNDLFLDTLGNLSETNSGAGTVAATLSNVTNSMSNFDGTGPATGGSITVVKGGDTLTFGVAASAVAATDSWTKDETLTEATVQSRALAGPAVVDVDGAGATVAYDIDAAGKVSQGGVANTVYLDGSTASPTDLTTVGTYTPADTVTTVYLHSNGNVMDGSGNRLYKDSDASNKTGLTTNARSGDASTANPLSVLDEALSRVDQLRSDLGAVQNRFDSVISNLGTTITNLTSSRSRIEDADYATEVSNMTRANILQQAGTSVLAQANQTTQGVLSLLR